MEHGPDDRVLRRSRRAAGARRRMQVLHDRPGDREKQHVDADACRKQHGHPGGQPVLRPRIVGAKPHAAFLGKGDPDHETDHQRHREHVVPTEVGGDPVHDKPHRGARSNGQQDGPYREGKDHHRRDHQNAPVDAGRTALHQLLCTFAQVAARERCVVVRTFMPALGAAKPAALNQRRRLRCLRVRYGPDSACGIVFGWFVGHGLVSFLGRAALWERMSDVSGGVQMPCPDRTQAAVFCPLRAMGQQCSAAYCAVALFALRAQAKNCMLERPRCASTMAPDQPQTRFWFVAADCTHQQWPVNGLLQTLLAMGWQGRAARV